MSRPDYLIVKLAAAGDVMLLTAMAAELRRLRPEAAIHWLTSAYCAPLLEGNPDLDGVLLAPAGFESARGARRLRALRGHAARETTVLLAHRSAWLLALLRAAGFRRVIGFSSRHHWARAATATFDTSRHRLEIHRELLRAAGLPAAAANAPRLELSAAERAWGEWAWGERGGAASPRWALAPGGAANPWSAMPARRWPAVRFAELAARAAAEGVCVGWIGGGADAALVPAGRGRNFAGAASLRQTAAIIAAADLVVGNDSLPLALAAALGRPGVGLYGPTAGALIHVGAGALQGEAGCGPCYDPRAGEAGAAYRCARALCMERIAVDAVWQSARRFGALPELRCS